LTSLFSNVGLSLNFGLAFRLIERLVQKVKLPVAF